MAFDIIPWDGEKISKPGLYANLPIEVYHSDCCDGPSISSSGLRSLFSASPAHFWSESYMNPDREEEDPSDAFILGRACHHLLLGEADFEKFFVIRPPELNGKPWQGNRTDCKEWLTMMKEEGFTILTPNMVEVIRGMSRSLSKNPLVQHGILNGLVEHSIIWKDEETGIWLKVRPDNCPLDSAVFADLKSTVSVSTDALAKAIADYGYFTQGALVGTASREVLGMRMESFSLVAVEKTAPYCSRVVTLKDCDLELGERVIRTALRTFANCLERNDWPGPGHQSDASYIEIPSFARTRIEAKATLMEEGILV